ncbi:hypothetical protein P153DRAFT_364126, partial [Dothidotthia symphoricarpi CBS 119687]
MQSADAGLQKAFSILPLELFLTVLDQLVGTRDGQQPIAYPPSHPVTKALRALTLVSHNISPIASRYLYTNCLYLSNSTSYARLRRTLGLNVGHPSQALKYGEAGLNDTIFADMPRYITSAFISPLKSDRDGHTIRLPHVINLFKTIGPMLKRLALDLQPVYTPASEVERIRPHISENNIFLHMPQLEELIVSFDVTDYFPYPPPNLKRLAITTQEMKDDGPLEFCFSISSLRTLVFLRPPELQATDIDRLFSYYKGHSLDAILVDVNSNHRTPLGTRAWKDDDKVRIWEVDVPTSFYGDDEDLVLCDNWMWNRGVEGTLWTQDKRGMTSWDDIERRLAGPVHQIAYGSH